MLPQTPVCKGLPVEQVAFRLHMQHPGYTGSSSKIPAMMNAICLQQDSQTLEMSCLTLDITRLGITMFKVNPYVPNRLQCTHTGALKRKHFPPHAIPLFFPSQSCCILSAQKCVTSDNIKVFLST